MIVVADSSPLHYLILIEQVGLVIPPNRMERELLAALAPAQVAVA